MDCLHDRERSLNCLRTAVSLMGKHAAVLDPISYAVWYDYAAGGSLELKKLLDEVTARAGQLSQDRTRELFLQHLAPRDDTPSLDLLARVLGLTQAVSHSTAMARQANDELDRSLSTFEHRLSAPPDPQALGVAVGDMRQASAQTHESIQQVSALLTRNSGEIERLRGELHQARQDAELDGLTQVLNRRALDRAVLECLAQAKAGPSVHPCLLLRAHQLDEAQALAERLRTQVANARVRKGQGDELRGQVTISVGAAALVHGESAAQWMQRADAAL